MRSATDLFFRGFRAAVGVRFQIPSQKPKKDFVEEFSGGVLLRKTNGKTWNDSDFPATLPRL